MSDAEMMPFEGKRAFSFEIGMNQIMRDINRDAKHKGFWTDINDLADTSISDETVALIARTQKAEKLLLVHAEISEAVEELRKPYGPHQSEKIPQYTTEEEELADAMIRIMDYAAQTGLDLPGAMIAKHNYNKTRPFKHGKEF